MRFSEAPLLVFCGFAVVVGLCSSTSLSEDACVPCNENFCARVRIICEEGTQPTPNFCKCTCECKKPPTATPTKKPTATPSCDPCSTLTCQRGYSCVADKNTCTARCEHRCNYCRRNPEPCNGITCGADEFCKPQCNRCNYKCVAKEKCPKNPCSGVLCGTDEQCVPNFKECTHTCMSCNFPCPLNYAPVCGSDGVTYGNECAFRGAKCRKPSLRILHKGECKKSDRTPVCNPSDPCIAVRCGFGTECVANLKDCSAKCVDTCIKGCPRIFRPVCGSDGKTYANQCLLDIAICKSKRNGEKLRKKNNGPCVTKEECPFKNPCDGITCRRRGQRCVPNFKECSYSCQSKCNPRIRCFAPACQFSNPCGKGEKCVPYCNSCLPSCEIKRSKNNCQKPCPKNLAPVCGTDGNTYDNDCLLEIAICESGGKIKKKSDGKCSKCNTNPCAFTTCLVGSSCEVDLTTCTARCVPRPDCRKGCPKILAPVCGTDGNTYNNDCLLEIASCESGGKIKKKSDGPCPPNCQRGCPFILAPVCGTDGNTYDNDCLLEIASCESGGKIQKKSDGRCQKDCRKGCPRILAPVCGTDGITYNNDCLLEIASCESGGKIKKKSDGRCPVVCPQICPAIFKPVCGSDGNTYSNDCTLGVKTCESGGSIKKVSDGPCPPKCRKGCPRILAPVCGTDGITYNNDCILEIASCESGGKIKKKSDGPCPPNCQRGCPFILAPVCGTDGNTYDNDCLLEIASCESGGKIQKKSDGRCQKECNTNPCAFTTCFVGSSCEVNLKTCTARCVPRPEECPRFCPLVFRPVCGSDGKTYSNDCFLGIATCLSKGKVQKVGDGPCQPKCEMLCPEIFAPVCGSDEVTYDNQCFLDIAICKSGGKLTKANDRKCKQCEKACQEIFAPVCGSDGITYDNQCYLDIAICKSGGKLTKVNDGKCEQKCDTQCENEVRIVCGSDNKNYLSECFLNNAICKSGGKIQKRHDGLCSDEFSKVKGLDLKPICGSDGRTYSNQAFLDIVNCLSGQKIEKVLDRPCECKNDNRCQDNFVCLAQYEGAKVTSCRSKCLPTPCAPPPFPEPLFCGTDGKTYTQCSFNQAKCLSDGKLEKRHGGPCEEKECPECENRYSPVCGSDGMTYTSDCHLRREICLRGDSSLQKNHNGPCEEFYARLEAADFNPVCASDGNKYSNDAYVGLQRCWESVETEPCPRREFPSCLRVNSSLKTEPTEPISNPGPIFCGQAITLFCKDDCKTCCVSPNTCGPDGFPKTGPQCDFEHPSTIPEEII